MYAVQKFFNYITLVLAVLTVGSCIYVVITHKSSLICLLLLILTFIFNAISRIYNNRNMNLTKKDKEMLENLKNNKKSIKK